MRVSATVSILVLAFSAILLLSIQRIQSSTQLSAQELLQAGFFSYEAGDYAIAEDKLNQFLSGYGASPEAKEYLEKILRLLALAQLQQSKFPAALNTLERYLREHPSGEMVSEFSFWHGVCLYQTKEYDRALPVLKDVAAKQPRHPQIEQVWMMIGMSHLALDQLAEALTFFLEHRDRFSPVMRGRILPVILHAQIQLEQWDALVAEMKTFDPYAEGMNSLSSVNLLAVQAGSRLLELERTRDALLVLQKAWPQQRLLSRQEKRLEDLKEKMRRPAKTSPVRKMEEINLSEQVAEIEKDIARVRAVEGYDTALRFRIARCFLLLERYREAFLVLDGMVKDLPESELLTQAHYQMLICLTRMERWGEVVRRADEFTQRFPKSPLVPTARYVKAESLMRMFQYDLAATEFFGIATAHPDFAEAERCHFLSGYALMMRDQNTDAVERFQSHLQKWPKGTFREQVVYWQAMAHYYHKDYEVSRTAHEAYLREYPKGQYAVDSNYRMAHALFGQKKFIECYKELEEFIRQHGGALQADEARNLLGDCYFAMGEVDRGLAAFQTTTRRDGRLFDYAAFRMGQAFKASELYDRMRQHFEKFLKERPDSPRLTEALSQLAWLHRKDGEPEKARDLYWQAVREHGNDPEAIAVEEMLGILGKFYRGEAKAEYDAALVRLVEEAQAAKKTTLASRGLWMRVQLQTEPAEKSRLLGRAFEAAKPTEMSARVLADVADSLRLSGRLEQAGECYRTILFWYPRSLLKDRSYAGLGLIAMQQEKPAEALRNFELFERETVQSPLWAEVLGARATLYASQGDLDRAVSELEKILEIPSARGLPWVEALYQAGEIRMKQGRPKQAIPYFQRIYIMYGRWTEHVARSYWQSGQAFEKLDMRKEAVNTYQELAQNTHLKETPEYVRALERLKQMGESVEKNTSTEGSTS